MQRRQQLQCLRHKRRRRTVKNTVYTETVQEELGESPVPLFFAVCARRKMEPEAIADSE